MKPDAPDSPPTGSTMPPASTGNETQVIDLSEVEVLVAQHNLESQRRLDAHGPPSLPPPLPASELARAMPPPVASVAPAEPPARSNAFYIVAILAFLVLGIGGGLLIANAVRTPAAAPPEPPRAARNAAVITIPTVEMNDADAAAK